MYERERALRAAIQITWDALWKLKYDDTVWIDRLSTWQPLLHVHNYLIQELEQLCPQSPPASSNLARTNDSAA